MSHFGETRGLSVGALHKGQRDDNTPVKERTSIREKEGTKSIDNPGLPVPFVTPLHSDNTSVRESSTFTELTESTSISQEKGHSPVPSVASMQSEQREPPTGEWTQSTYIQYGRPPSSVSSVSLHSNDSMKEPPGFAGELSQRTSGCTRSLLCSACPKRAFKSCLTCMASFCEAHVVMHFTASALQRHRLVEATGDLEQRLCQQHYRELEFFCKTDQTPVCAVCIAKQHWGHHLAELAEHESVQMEESKLTTQKNLPSPKPIQFMSVTTDSVCLSWGAPEGLSGHPQFTVTWRSEVDCGSLTVPGEVIDIQNLAPGENYTFTVATLCDDGSQSSCVSATTRTDIPAPENISVNAHLSSVSVTWSKPPGVDVASYLVTLSSGGKCIKTVSTKYLNCCFPELEMGTEYYIGASTVQKKGGQGKPISKVIRLVVPLPEELKVVSVTVTSVSLTWSPPHGMDHIPHSFLVSYSSNGTEKSITADSCSTEISDLQPGTDYTVRVQTKLKNETLSKAVTIEIYTGSVIVKKLKRKCMLLRPGIPALCLLPTENSYIGNSSVRKWTFGKRDKSKPLKTVLLVGETGTGRTSLINTMINYLLRVRWEDRVWFQISDSATTSRIESETMAIYVYELFLETSHLYLRIIDTPGYGNTDGIEVDGEIAEKLHVFFRSEDGIHEIDVVGLVVKSSLNRFTDFQRYIFDSILSLFGKNIEKKIVVFITHSDGLPASNVTTALDKARVPYAKDPCGKPLHFMFNNRQHETYEEDQMDLLQIFWNLGYKSVERFFYVLKEFDSINVTMTEGVLRERKRLEACTSNLKDAILLEELKQNMLTQTKKALEKCSKKFGNNEFTYEVDEPYKARVPIESSWWPLDKSAMCCTICKENCHFPGCWWVKNLSWCEVMKDGRCTVCTNKCPVSAHVKEPFIYVIKTKRVYKTAVDLKQYEEQVNCKRRMENELSDSKAKQSKLLDDAYECIVILEKIALEKNVLSTHIDLDFLIEKMEAMGEDEKVRYLRKLNKNMKASHKKDRGYFKQAYRYVLGNAKPRIL